MSKILVSFHCPVFDNGFKIVAFYEGFIKALEDEGNEVLVVNTSEFLHRSWNNNSNELPFYFNKNKIVQDTKKFDPNVVIAFNHSIPLEIEEACNCPIVLWDSDAIQFFSDKNYIKRNLDRYVFFCFNESGVKDALLFGAKKSKVHLVKLATHIQKEDKEIRQNISFIGSNFVCRPNFINLLATEDIQKLRKLSDSLVGKFFEDTDDIYKLYDLEHIPQDIRREDLISLSSVQDRITVLNNIQDLGLVIWGTKNWINTGYQLPWLAMCYNKKVVYSLKHNQDIYNSSKLCVSVSHSQAIEGYPFRIMDIMASNGCLLSDYHSGIEDLTKGYVDIPMYDNPYDVRDLAKKLLSDDVWRKDIVLGSQKCVEDKCRWSLRFKQMEEILGVSFLNKEEVVKNNFDVDRVRYMRKIEYLILTHSFFKHIIAILAILIPKKLLVKLYILLNRFFGLRIDEQTVGDIKSKSNIIRTAIKSFVGLIKK